MNQRSSIDLVGSVAGGKITFEQYMPAPALAELDPCHYHVDTGCSCSSPYTFAEYEREALPVSKEQVDSALSIVAGLDMSALEVAGYWLRLINTLCGLGGVPLEEVAKRSLALSYPSDAEAPGGLRRVQ